MSVIETGGIDCDLHPAVPNIKALHPYLSDTGATSSSSAASS